MKPRGFALVIVLWSMVLLSLIMTHLIAAGRTEARIAGNLVANAEAEEAANGAVWEAIFRLQDGSERHWAIAGGAHLLKLYRAEATVRILPENGKINPNTASIEIMTALLAVCAAGDPDSLAQAIADWRDAGETPRPRGAKSAQYRAAGFDYGPPDAPFESLEEMRRVLGMTPALLRCLKPHLSLYQEGEPDPAAADPIVADIVRRLNLNRPAQNGGDGRRPQTVALIAQAVTQSGGNFQRRALVRLDPAAPGSYRLLAWDTEAE